MSVEAKSSQGDFGTSGLPQTAALDVERALLEVRTERLATVVDLVRALRGSPEPTS